LQFWRHAGQDIFERITANELAFQRLYDACGKWLERDDH
jgi:hypothetical protein